MSHAVLLCSSSVATAFIASLLQGRDTHHKHTHTHMGRHTLTQAHVQTHKHSHKHTYRHTNTHIHSLTSAFV
uniref:Secreted protein n=1 Tax=Anguilla anguilla TaxID=7936 RepID=A0A0E9SKJ2_ANGAN